MAFVPVSIRFAAGDKGASSYDRSIQLTAKQFRAFTAEAGDMTEPFGMVARDMRGEVAAAFATDGASGASGNWATLSQPYADWKAKHGGGSLPLLWGLRPIEPVHHRPAAPNMNQRYAPSEPPGQMRAQLLAPLADMLTWHVNSRRMLYTPQSDIAGFHQTGTNNMPARPPVDLSIAFLRQIDRSFVRWLAGLVKKSGL